MNANTPFTGPVFGRRDPDSRGYFGGYGGRFVPETLMAPLDELRDAYFAPAAGRGVSERPDAPARRPSRAGRRRSTRRGGSSADAGGARIFLKREDLTHTGAHKINNALGQALLAARMGKSRVVAETGRRPARRRLGDRLRAARPSSARSTWAPTTWSARR